MWGVGLGGGYEIGGGSDQRHGVYDFIFMDMELREKGISTGFSVRGQNQTRQAPCCQMGGGLGRWV